MYVGIEKETICIFTAEQTWPPLITHSGSWQELLVTNFQAGKFPLSGQGAQGLHDLRKIIWGHLGF